MLLQTPCVIRDAICHAEHLMHRGFQLGNDGKAYQNTPGMDSPSVGFATAYILSACAMPGYSAKLCGLLLQYSSLEGTILSSTS
jgi:hypothetical protein